MMRDTRTSEGIFAEGVTVTYRNGLTALTDASFQIPQGTITALVGVNGAGKSTLFKAIMGFVPIARGTIRLLGMPVRDALRQNLVAYVPQAEEVDWSFPILVEDVVMMGRYGRMGFTRRPSSADHRAVDEALARVGLVDEAHRQIGRLSGGQRKRAFLARGIAQGATTLLLDEPFAGIDKHSEAAIVQLLHALGAAGHTILVSTHDLHGLVELADEAVLLMKRVLLQGDPAEVLRPENLALAFGLDPVRAEGPA